MAEHSKGGVSDAAAYRIDAELRSRLARLSARVIELESEVERVNGENQRLHVELDAIRQSTSWRVTRPLRGLRGGS